MTNVSGKSHTPGKSKAEEQEDLTEQLEETFPASDPPSMTQPKSHPGGPAKRSDTGVEAELARQQAAKQKLQK